MVALFCLQLELTSLPCTPLVQLRKTNLSQAHREKNTEVKVTKKQNHMLAYIFSKIFHYQVQPMVSSFLFGNHKLRLFVRFLDFTYLFTGLDFVLNLYSSTIKYLINKHLRERNRQASSMALGNLRSQKDPRLCQPADKILRLSSKLSL